MLSLAYNPMDVPVIVDEQSRSVGGRLWGTVETTERLAKRELDAGRLILVDADALSKSDRPEVRQALAHLEQRRKVEDEVRGQDKRDLIENLPAEAVAGLPVGGDGLPAKADVVDAAVEQKLTSKSTGRRSGQRES